MNSCSATTKLALYTISTPSTRRIRETPSSSRSGVGRGCTLALMRRLPQPARISAPPRPPGTGSPAPRSRDTCRSWCSRGRAAPRRRRMPPCRAWATASSMPATRMMRGGIPSPGSATARAMASALSPINTRAFTLRRISLAHSPRGSALSRPPAMSTVGTSKERRLATERSGAVAMESL